MSAKRALSWLHRGWTLFVDPERDKRIESFTAMLHRDLAAQKKKFQFSTAADQYGIDEIDRIEVRDRLFEKCLTRAWNDGEISDQEARSLDWISVALGLSQVQVMAMKRKYAAQYFSSSLAAAFVDGVLDDSEYEHLNSIAQTCGETATSFFRDEFRHDGEGFIRTLFLKVWEDGRMDADEWRAIQSTAKRIGLSDAEFREVIRAPAQQLVEHFLADYKSDLEISPDEQSTLEWMLVHLIDDQRFAAYVRAEIAMGSQISLIRRGTLPSVAPPPGIAVRAGEIVHFHSPAVYAYVKRRANVNETVRVSGNVVVTDDRLLFTSVERSQQLILSSILGYERRHHGVEIQASGKGAGYYEFSSNSGIGIEIIMAAIAKVNQTLIAPEAKNDARKIARDVRQRVWQKYGGRCAECNATQYLEFDHIIPVARGGGNSESNVQLLCRGCNSKKSDRI